MAKFGNGPRGAYAVQGDRLTGWAVGSDRDMPARVAVYMDDLELCVLNAVLPRPDVARKLGFASDRCGFDYTIPDHFIGPLQHSLRLEILPERVVLAGPPSKVSFDVSTLLTTEKMVPLAALARPAEPSGNGAPARPASRWLAPAIENLAQIATGAHAPFLQAVTAPTEIPIEDRAEVSRVASVMVVRNGPVVALGRGSVEEYCENSLRVHQRWITRAMRGGRQAYVERPTLVVQRKGIDNYYHWMTEFLPKILASRWDGPARPVDITTFGNAFIPSSIDYLGLSSQVGTIHEADALVLADAYLPQFNRKLTPRDTRIDGYFFELRDLIEARAASAPRAPGRGRAIFVDRGDAGTRRLLNREALLAELKRHDIEPVLMSGRTIAEQAEIFAGADAIVGIHGAALTNLMFARKGTKVLEIIPAALVPRIRCYMDLSAVGGLGYSAYIEENEMLERENFNLDVERFTRCLEEFLEPARC
ncbi:glycosyltransferase family 61 protein [Breoghania sp. L-A4]|nr:glycosyltransferase family 61 protein [Breoghania sp. L-A4]